MAVLQIIHRLSLTWKIPLLKQFLHGVQKEQIFSLYLTSHVQGFHKQQHPFLHAECSTFAARVCNASNTLDFPPPFGPYIAETGKNCSLSLSFIILSSCSEIAAASFPYSFSFSIIPGPKIL